jgi:HupE / UreJ protein
MKNIDKSLLRRAEFFVFTALVFLVSNSLAAHGITDSDKAIMLDGGYFQYMWLGASHMLTGYDHLLFLFGVIFFLTEFKEIVKFISAFTLGHCITLIFATFMKITANYYLVDAVIALTVFYKGFDNVDGFQKYLKMKSPNMVWLVFAFGLIHGFGLSTRLQQLPLGKEGLLARILSFNLGVEVGQILALSVMLGLLTAWRKTESFKKFTTISNVGIMVAGIGLFLMQMHGFVFADDNGADTRAKVKPAVANVTKVKETAAPQPIAQKSQWKDSVTITVPPGKGVEYKFHIVKGQVFNYSWKTDGAGLFYDFHGEPDGDTTGYFESFEKKTSSESVASFEVPFDGNHGWYWKNKGTVPVTVTLKTKGTYKILGLR